MLKTKIKILLTIVIGALLIFSCQSQKTKSHSDKFITEDITNFYEMFSQLKTATSVTDTLKILNHFESTRPLKKIVQKIIYRNNKHFKSPDFDLNDRLLRKMGEPSLSKWKEFLF